MTAVADAPFGGQRAGGRSTAAQGFERYLVYAGVFLAPFLNLQTELMFFTLSDGLLSLALVVMLVRGRLRRNPFGPVLLFWVAAFVLVVGGLYLSSIMTGQLVRGIILSLQYTFCFVALPFVLASGDEDEAFRLLLIFILGVVAVDIHGIIAYFTIGYVPGSRLITGGGRLSTVIGNANGAGALNAMTIIAVLWLRSLQRISLVFTLAVLSIMVWVVVLTSSNTALISTAGGLAIFVLCSFRPKLIFIAAVVAALGAVFLHFGGLDYLPTAFHKRVLGALESGDIEEAGTFADRAALMEEAIEMLRGREFDLLGIGADQFRVVSVQRIPVHNSFLILWVEGGLLSLLGWVLFCSMGLVVWLYSLRKRVVIEGSAAVMAICAAFVVFSNTAAHVYARPWHIALILVMQPMILMLARPQRRGSGAVPAPFAALSSARVGS